MIEKQPMPTVRRNKGGDGLYHRKGRGWYAVVEFAKKGGKRDRRWYGPFDTSESAKSERDKRRNEARQGVDLDPRKTTFGEFLDRWLTYQETKPTPVAPRTIGGYKSIVETRLRPGLGHFKLSQLTAMRFAEMVASWSKGKRLDGKKGTINSRSVAANVRVLRMALKQAARWRLISHELAASVEAPRVERASAVFVQVTDVPALTAAAKATKLYAPVATCLGLGLRRGELLGLQWRDVDLEQGVIRIERALQRIDHKLVTAPPKTKLSARVLTSSPLRARRAARVSGVNPSGTDERRPRQAPRHALCVRESERRPARPGLVRQAVRQGYEGRRARRSPPLAAPRVRRAQPGGRDRLEGR